MTVSTSATIGGEHPSVVVKSWPHGPRSVDRARRLLARHLEAWSLGHLADAAELVVSELLTNSVRHAREPRGHVIGTRFERLRCGVRIEVHDAGVDKPERREASADAESGRGLALVDVITGGRWGVNDRDGVGKVVWAVCADDGTDADSPYAGASPLAG
ncbi:ATP-binding protein [Streptomyces sp. NPDC049040]|uniref:ATP-binding protein n=1 Tax=Streptomyces sp. NPDC049040 TaxID=3365593 RepID=UPI00371D234C